MSSAPTPSAERIAELTTVLRMTTLDDMDGFEYGRPLLVGELRSLLDSHARLVEAGRLLRLADDWLAGYQIHLRDHRDATGQREIAAFKQRIAAFLSPATATEEPQLPQSVGPTDTENNR